MRRRRRRRRRRTKKAIPSSWWFIAHKVDLCATPFLTDSNADGGSVVGVRSINHASLHNVNEQKVHPPPSLPLPNHCLIHFEPPLPPLQPPLFAHFGGQEAALSPSTRTTTCLLASFMSKLGGDGDRFGDYLRVDYTNLLCINRHIQITNLKCTSTIFKISKPIYERVSRRPRVSEQ